MIDRVNIVRSLTWNSVCLVRFRRQGYFFNLLTFHACTVTPETLSDYLFLYAKYSILMKVLSIYVIPRTIDRRLLGIKFVESMF